TALTLLRHEGMAGAAWQWLRGGELTEPQRQALRDRGITSSQVHDDDGALAALRALSLLFGHGGRHLLLIVDELQQLRENGNTSLEAVTASTLTPLMGWAAETGALLTLCGLQDFWSALPPSVHQRVNANVIKPTWLTGNQIEEYICEAQLQENGERVLEPFTSAAVTALWRITGGHPRRSIAICHHAYRRSGGREKIDELEMQVAAKEQSSPGTVDDAQLQITEHCARLGYRVVRPAGRNSLRHDEPDLWIPARNSSDDGCGFVIIDSVLTDEECIAVIARGESISGLSRSGQGAPQRDVVLVVTGLLAESYAQEFSLAYGRVLDWSKAGFTDNLTETLRAFVPVERPSSELELLQKLQRDVQELRESVRGHPDRPATSDLPTGGTAPGQPGTWIELGEGEAMEYLSGRCNDLLRTLRDALVEAQRFWFGQFVPSLPERRLVRHNAPGLRGVALKDLTGNQVLRAMGVLTAMEQALLGFALGISEQLSRAVASPRSTRLELKQECERFDSTVSALIERMPSDHEDTIKIVNRALGVDRRLLGQKASRLGDLVFETIYREEFGRR
ncbi:MAG: hypothetical protein ABIS86_18015, partial [Streptosporangiaceae bacterium]